MRRSSLSSPPWSGKVRPICARVLPSALETRVAGELSVAFEFGVATGVAVERFSGAAFGGGMACAACAAGA